ncbi:MAG: hypothetical protein JO194_08305 [Candidatus Eremiobacteraeota bacterium]|nr:hypothetical protein [Candidatus Eremiobacteraeota bacterium]
MSGVFEDPDPQSLPTCKPFVGRPFVVRVDESAVSSPTFAADIVFMRRIGVRPVLIHDVGAREPAQWLIGSINRVGGAAVGLDGLAASTLTASAGESGAVELRGVNAALLHLLLEQGYIPVIASQGSAISGAPLTVDVDEAARALAGAIGAIRLLFGSQPGGIPSDDSGVIEELTSSEALALVASGGLSSDLATRLSAAALGVRAGVDAAQILDLSTAHAAIVELLTAQHLGTQIISNILVG